MTSFDIDLFVIRGRSGGARGSDRSDKATDKVVGVHIMGHDAGEMIQLAAIAITMGATKVDFDRVVAVHPTAAEELVTMGTPVVVKKPVTVEQFSWSVRLVELGRNPREEACMTWTINHSYNRTLVAEANTSFRGSHAPLLLTTLIAMFSLLSAIHAPRVHAHENSQLNAAWIPTADGRAQPTPAWSEFCERSPTECAISLAEPAAVELTERLWNVIAAINKYVNAAVSPREDIDHWGVIDRWDYPDDGYGDCEDYQILKRRLLVEAGLPRRALRMVVVLDELGAGHAVLAVRTDSGDFILDNKKDPILLWHQTGYIYIKSEGDRSFAWVWLHRQAAVTSAIHPY